MKSCFVSKPVEFDGFKIRIILFTTSAKVSTASVLLIGVIIAGAVALFSYGIARIAKIVKSINLTQELTLFNFVKKRQG